MTTTLESIVDELEHELVDAQDDMTIAELVTELSAA
jgi:hypothetical protein